MRRDENNLKQMSERAEDRWSITESVCRGCDCSSLRPRSDIPWRVRLSRGFTFVELLATMVLISIVMPVAMRSIGLCTQIAGQSRRQIEAVWLAKTKLTELIVTEDWENGSGRGGFRNGLARLRVDDDADQLAEMPPSASSI